MPTRLSARSVLLLLMLSACAVLGAGESSGPGGKPVGGGGGDKPDENPIPQITGLNVDVPPFRFSTDVGDTDKERKAFAQRIMKPVLSTTEHFLKLYRLKPRAFEDYAETYKGNNFEKLVRIDVWKDYEGFLENFQRRYETKTIPGAFFGVSPVKDPYGKETGAWLREIGLAAEGAGDEQILRHIYHELGHLFMKTYMVVSVEVPSWIEEGTAELFQLHPSNGTKPEPERVQRQGWLREILEEGSTIPFPEFVKVRNMDNLDFTWKDPLRSTLQYAQAWSVIEFVIASPQRQEAFFKMLADFKSSGEYRLGELARQGLKDQALRDKLRAHLYEVQEELFKKRFGAELVKIEDLWKDWVRKNYDKDLVKKPALRYHRGEWRIIRARRAKTREDALAHLAKAEEIFKECMEKSPGEPEGWVGMGRLAMMTGKHDEAWPLFATALEKGSENTEAVLYGGIARMQRGEAKAAIEPLAKAVADRPNSFEANFWYGQALTAGGGDTAKAVAAFAIAAGVEKDRAGECSWREGVAHLLGGRQREARLAFMRSLGQPGVPPQAGAWFAFVTAADGERAEALDLLARVEAGPDRDALQARLSQTGAEAPLPAIAFDERGQPFLDAKADWTPPPPPKGKPGAKK